MKIKHMFEMNRPRVQRTWDLMLWKIICLLLCYNFFCIRFTCSALYTPVTNGMLQKTPFLLPTIFWDPRNPLFNCPGKGINTINVRVNDYFRLACPKPGRLVDSHTVLDIPTGEMYENAFMTENEAQFNQCIADASLAPLMSCNDPVNGNVFRTVRLAMHSGSSSDPLFVPGTTYYLYDTSTGLQSDLNNRAGGRCNASTGPYTFQVKLKLHVCLLGEAGTPKCPICQTAACYNYGCATYSEWKETEKYQRLNGSCFKVHERACNYNGGFCDGPLEKLVKAPNETCQESPRDSKIEFNTTVTTSNCSIVFKTTCMKGKVPVYCSEEQENIVVKKSLCNGGNSSAPIAAGRYADEPKTVSMIVGMFVLVLIAAAVTGLFVGIGFAFIYVKKYAPPASEERSRLRRAGKC